MNSQPRKPLYAILVAPGEEERKKIISGEITATIREGRRNYNTGIGMLCCHINPWVVMTTIIEVKYCRLQALKEEEYKKAGYDSLEDALQKMKKYYPKLDFESEITMITWTNVRGKLVDQ